MKLNKIFLFATVAAASLFAVSCDDDKDNDYSGPGEWNATENYAQLYFQETSKTESVDPADPTTYTFQVYRRVSHEYVFGKDSLGQVIPDSIVSDTITTKLPKLTAKPTLIVNTDSVFTVSDVTFEEGDTVANVTLSFPNAEIGKQYTAQIKFDDPALTSIYSANISYTYKVTRVKWNLLGEGKYYDYFIGVTAENIEIYQRDDAPKYFRIMNPYKDIMAEWADAGYPITNDASEYIDIRILDKGEVVNDVTIEDKDIVYWERINTGCAHPSYGETIWHLHASNFTSRNDYDHYQYNYVISYQEDGTPGQIQLASMPYMFDVGGWDYTQPETKEDAIIITFPGFVEQYEATIDEDFTWEKVYEGKFASEQLGTTTNAILMKGICTTTTDACDSIFAETYGTPYKIVAPYAEGSDLIFCAKDKKILLAPGYEDPQPIGIKAVGKNVYATINAGKSSFASDGDIITLNITFADKDGEIEFGTADEKMMNLTYTEIGTGVYTYGVDALSQNAGSFYEGTENATLFQCDQDPSQYYLAPWAKSEEGFIFTVQADKTIKFYQSTGENYVEEGEDYGTVYFMDIEEYNPNYAEYLGKYDGNKTFEFVGSYYIPGVGGFGLIAETFVLDGEEAADGARTLHSKDLRLNKTYRAPSRFKAKKVNKTQRNGQKNWKSAIRPSMELLTK